MFLSSTLTPFSLSEPHPSISLIFLFTDLSFTSPPLALVPPRFFPLLNFSYISHPLLLSVPLLLLPLTFSIPPSCCLTYFSIPFFLPPPHFSFFLGSRIIARCFFFLCSFRADFSFSSLLNCFLVHIF